MSITGEELAIWVSLWLFVTFVSACEGPFVLVSPHPSPF